MPRGNAKAMAAVQEPITQPSSFEQSLLDDSDFPSHKLNDPIQFQNPGSEAYDAPYRQSYIEDLEDDDILEEDEPIDDDDLILEEEATDRPVTFHLLKAKGTKPNLTTEDGQPLDDGYPQTYYMPHSDVITYKGDDEDKNGKRFHGRQRTIRYIPGESSIYKDEQAEDAEFKNCGDIVFFKGILRIHPNDNPLMIEYLRNVNHNNTNPNAVRRKKVFEEVIIGKAEKEEEDIFDLRHEAVDKVSDLRNVDLLIFCKYFMIETKGKQVKQLRLELKKYADRNPKEFLAAFTDPNFKIKQVFILAQDRRIITYKEMPNTLCWISGGDRTPIVNWPAGDEALDFLAKWATMKAGNQYFNRIKEMVKEVSR